jgi:hypothetical protein
MTGLSPWAVILVLTRVGRVRRMRVGLQATSSDIWLSLDFPIVVHVYVDVRLWGFSCTLVAEGALDKYLRLLARVHTTILGKPFYVKSGRKRKLFGGSVDLSHLDYGVLEIVSKSI